MSGLKKIFRIFPQTGIEFCRFENLLQPFPPHFHEYCLLGCLLKGERIFQCGNSSFHIRPGDLIALNARQLHSCQPVGINPSTWSCLHISLENMKTLSGLSNPSFSAPVFPALGEILQEMTSILAEKKQLPEKLLCRLREKILMQKPKNKPAPVFKNSGAIYQLCSYLQKNPDRDFNLEEMSCLLKMNKFSLIRYFSKIVGVTPHRYLEILRLNKGHELLKTDLPICQIALHSGFYDQSHFSRRFFQNTALTPGFYKKAYRHTPANNP